MLQAKELVESIQPKKTVEARCECSESEAAVSVLVVDGKEVKFRTCLSCAERAAKGDTSILAMFISQPYSVQRIIGEWLELRKVVEDTARAAQTRKH